MFVFFFFNQKTAYEMRISDWSSDVCSSDLHVCAENARRRQRASIGNAASQNDRPIKELADFRHKGKGDQPAGIAARPCRQQDQAVHARFGRTPRVLDACSLRYDNAAISVDALDDVDRAPHRSEENTSDIKSIMRIS